MTSLLTIALLLNVAPTRPHAEATAVDWQRYASAMYTLGLEQRADTEHAQQAFRDAAFAYERVWERGGQTPDVAANMGQAYFLAGELNQSIVAYRRGLAHFPQDRTLRAGLSEVRARVAYPRTGELAEMARPRDPQPFAGDVPPILLWVVFMTCHAFGWYALVRAWLHGPWSRWALGASFVVGSLAFGTWFVWQSQQAADYWQQPTAVVRSGGVELRLGNSNEYPRRFDGRFPEGVELAILGERGGWLQVELANGMVGWIPQQAASELRRELR